MKSVNFSNWIIANRVWAFLVVPAALSGLMMGLYFSGVESLQQIAAPTIEGLAPFSWREFGILELLQNVFLLGIAWYLFRSAMILGLTLQGSLFAILMLLFLFVLLEEIDYGLHFIEYFTGSGTDLSGEWDRNLHNLSTEEGVQYGSYMKAVATASLVIVFFLAPFALSKSNNLLVCLFTPSRWAAANVLLIVLFSQIAHALDSAGFSHINGTPGNLEHNISEFRELNMYYLFLLYFAELKERLGKPGE